MRLQCCREAMPSLSPAAAGVLAQQFKELAEQLRKVREAACASKDASGFGGRKVLDVLEQFAKLPVTAEVLKETGAGKEVNDIFVRRHADSLVRERSKELVSKWKARIKDAQDAEVAQEAEKARVKAAKAAMEAERAASNALLAAADAAAPTSPVVATSGAGLATPASPSKRKAEEAGGNDVAKTAKVEGDVGPNEAIAALFKELSDFEFKKKDVHRGVAYKKVAARLRGHPEQIRSGKDAQKLEDIGSNSSKKIDEFLSTGKIERIEKYRRGELD